ncbi:MAG TPA: LCP family protein [Solirubrobacteraceae bacterium]|nr:LCP family protein [Solirubrobacteraceae bacterium]
MWKRFLAAMVAIVFFTAAASATAVLLEVDSAVKAFTRYNQPIADIEGALDDVDAGDPQTILLIGSDKRWGDTKAGIKPRSDTIILVRLDPDQDASAILSIPRDLKVSYTGKDGGTYNDKINAAYSMGGPKATVSKIKQLMGGDFPIHHVVNVNFGAFTRAVKRLGCFYIDVDRRYFNDNAPPVASETNYATIDLKPGYQKLCGQDSLDFVRFRHLDTDIVRGARQQHYLSEAKDQLGVERLFQDREELLELFGRYTDTDIKSSGAVLRLLKLTYEASRSPLRRVNFRADLGQEFVTITDENLARVRREFLEVKASKGTQTTKARPKSSARKSAAKKNRKSAATPGLDATGTPVEDAAILAQARLNFPVYYPKLIRTGGRFWDGFSSDKPRTYDLFGPGKERYRAYRFTVEAPGLGEYYGVQGTNWKNPPVLSKPSGYQTVKGRKVMLFRDGSRLRMVGWKTDKASYWVSNTLLRSLTNRQMIALAGSLTRIGG